MSDYLVRLAGRPLTRRLIGTVGLPTPQALARARGPYEAIPLAGKHAVCGGMGESVTGRAGRRALLAAGASIETDAVARVDIAMYDATQLRDVADLRNLYNFFHPLVTRLATNARVLVMTAPPEAADNAAGAAVRRAVEGFVRSLAKEIGKRGATANLVYVEAGAEDRLEGPVRFLLSARSAYVDGQPVRVSLRVKAPAASTQHAPLTGKVALVTGAARGIGAAIARRLVEEGARVVCLDIPADRATLDATAHAIGAVALPLDITGADAPRALVEFFREKFGGVDVVVHNAGVTRDKTIAKMDERLWDSCLAVNLASIVNIDRAFDDATLLRDQGRVVCLSSIAGIAGNVGQTNYAATKAGIIGYVAARARELAARGVAVNAVAPGFIETRLTRAVPFLLREFGRRLNSLSQGGVPDDVAEAVVFLATPGAYGITGQTLRVCGQSLLGA